MDAVVQLIRNALCCIKDLNLFAQVYPSLHEPFEPLTKLSTNNDYSFLQTILSQLPASSSSSLSSSINQITPLEMAIALSQLYACISCTLSGYRLLRYGGLAKLQHLTQVLQSRKNVTEEKAKQTISTNKNTNTNQEANSKFASDCITTCLLQEASSALQSVLVGMCVFLTGISFFWLFGNSLHITETNLIGGLPALIHALIVMEIALMVILYYMWKDAKAYMNKSQTLLDLSLTFEEKMSKEKKDWLDCDTLICLMEIRNEYGGKASSSSSSKLLLLPPPIWKGIDDSSEESYKMELDRMALLIQQIYDPQQYSFSKDFGHSPTELTPLIHASSQRSKYQGYREYVYWILNFIAFYGYMLGILVYYIDKEREETTIVRMLKLGYTHEYADWAGNFAGDLMWTIEPIIILFSPLLLGMLSLSAKPKKEIEEAKKKKD